MSYDGHPTFSGIIDGNDRNGTEGKCILKRDTVGTKVGTGNVSSPREVAASYESPDASNRA